MRTVIDVVISDNYSLFVRSRVVNLIFHTMFVTNDTRNGTNLHNIVENALR